MTLDDTHPQFLRCIILNEIKTGGIIQFYQMHYEY